MSGGVCVVVPAYREAFAIAEVVEDLLRYQTWVVVVDDGSDDDTAELAAEAGARVVRHCVNRGQGAALQTGIDCALAGGADIVVTFDGDGQHAATDVAALLEPIAQGRVDVVLGSRRLGSAEGMPRVRALVLSLALRLTRATSGLAVTDTHNGLRAFSRAAAERLRIRCDGMAHASELLDQVGRLGLSWCEVPVHLRYTDYSRAKGQRLTDAWRVALDYLLGSLLR